MNWKRLLASTSGSVEQELLLSNESLATKNRSLRNQIQDRLPLNDSDRITLAEIGKRLGRLRILQRHGLLPAPDRQRKTSWREFIRSHMEVSAAVGFFTAEVWTSAELITDYVAHFHAECNHHGKDNVILFPEPKDHLGESIGPIQTRERLGGLPKFILSRGRMSFLTIRGCFTESAHPLVRWKTLVAKRVLRMINPRTLIPPSLSNT